jgi:hypothetical protein
VQRILSGQQVHVHASGRRVRQPHLLHPSCNVLGPRRHSPGAQSSALQSCRCSGAAWLTFRNRASSPLQTYRYDAFRSGNNTIALTKYGTNVFFTTGLPGWDLPAGETSSAVATQHCCDAANRCRQGVPGGKRTFPTPAPPSGTWNVNISVIDSLSSRPWRPR